MTEGIDSIVIVGAGQAGATVALGLRRAGFKGAVTLVGEEVHLPYERPQLSKELLWPERGNLQFIKDASVYDESSIRLVLGRTVVDADDKRVLLDDGQALVYDRLVIATGVRARKLPNYLDIPERVGYLRSIEDARRLRLDIDAGRSLAIIGGGVIGLEVAAAANAAGCKVTVIETAERLMSRSIDDVVAAYLDRAHRRNGIDIRYGVSATTFSGDSTLKLSDGSEVPAERVLVGIGVVPNIEGLASLGISDKWGIQVDEFGRSANPRVYATGDVASQPQAGAFGRIETWANAQDHALNVVKNLLGGNVPYQSPTWFWSDQGRINLQAVGDATQGLRVIRGDAGGENLSVFWLDEDTQQVTGCATVNAPRDMAIARRWVKQAARVDRQKLQNETIQLRECVI